MEKAVAVAQSCGAIEGSARVGHVNSIAAELHMNFE